MYWADCTWRDAFWNGEKEVFDAELGVIVIEVEHIDVYLEGSEESDWT